MPMNELNEIGVVVKPHGLKGHLVLKVEPNVYHLFASFSSVFLRLGGSDVPFMIEDVAPLNQGKIKVKFTGIANSTKAEALRGVTVWQVQELLGVEEQLDLSGFVLYGDDGAKVGQVQEVMDNQMQVLLLVETANVEVYVPLVDELIIKVDAQRKALTMRIPEGLLDL